LYYLIYLYYFCYLDQEQELTLETVTERLQWHIAQFLVRIREKCKMSHTVIEHIIDGVTHLLDTYSAIVIVSCNYYFRCDQFLLYIFR